MSDSTRRVAVVGYFASARSAEGDSKEFGGQTAKCRMLRDWLQSLDAIAYSEIDTYRWKTNPLRLFSRTIREAKRADVVLMALSENGLRMIMPILLRLRSYFGFRLGYVVIGGWVTKRCEEDFAFLRKLGELDAIFAETTSMADDLRAQGLENVHYVPNAKKLEVLAEPVKIDASSRPLPVCVFSRVCREKGVTTAVEAVARVNSEHGATEYFLDIYGPVADDYREELDCLLELHSDSVAYKGSVPAGESVGVLNRYLLLLFPTRYYGEGFPGTIVDAFSAGVPVVTSDWRNARSIVEDGETGLIYGFDDPDGAYETLEKCLNEPSEVCRMRRRCLQESIKYAPDRANEPIWDFITNASNMPLRQNKG